MKTLSLKIGAFLIVSGSFIWYGCQKDDFSDMDNNMTSTVSLSAVTMDMETGTGFVGKGDVQIVFGWNNKQLQDNADKVQFRLFSESVSETTWTCKRDAGTQTNERSRTTTSSIQGLLESVARERNQITGFNIQGFDGDPDIDEETDGPAVGSCANGWSVIEGPDTAVSGSNGGLQVSINGTDWFDLE
jgi:hypothetical protein